MGSTGGQGTGASPIGPGAPPTRSAGSGSVTRPRRRGRRVQPRGPGEWHRPPGRRGDKRGPERAATGTVGCLGAGGGSAGGGHLRGLDPERSAHSRRAAGGVPAGRADRRGGGGEDRDLGLLGCRLLNEVGASLKWATAKVERTSQRGNGDRAQGRERQAERGGDFNDAPPF